MKYIVSYFDRENNILQKNPNLDVETCEFMSPKRKPWSNPDIAKRRCKRCNGRGVQLFDNPKNQTQWLVACDCVIKAMNKGGMKLPELDELVNVETQDDD